MDWTRVRTRCLSLSVQLLACCLMRSLGWRVNRNPEMGFPFWVIAPVHHQRGDGPSHRLGSLLYTISCSLTLSHSLLTHTQTHSMDSWKNIQSSLTNINLGQSASKLAKGFNSSVQATRERLGQVAADEITE
jgi:hypothetical protein